ncbi:MULTISPECIES: molybdopterin-binding protein [Shewanella]|uniref:Transporter n=1 Tax=Shewanella polaris TaxID=2588449 RepID=A0A4Y5YEM7_9GAMM|nr:MULTISPECIES: molybdopterin-binding protein [Shewanella]QDE31230.1 transporter [Shewanella polaris]
MKISARNQLKGTVKTIQAGAVNSEIMIELSGGEQIASIITNEAVKSLNLKVGSTAYAIVKASNVMLGIDG